MLRRSQSWSWWTRPSTNRTRRENQKLKRWGCKALRWNHWTINPTVGMPRSREVGWDLSRIEQNRGKEEGCRSNDPRISSSVSWSIGARIIEGTSRHGKRFLRWSKKCRSIIVCWSFRSSIKVSWSSCRIKKAKRRYAAEDARESSRPTLGSIRYWKHRICLQNAVWSNGWISIGTT